MDDELTEMRRQRDGWMREVSRLYRGQNSLTWGTPPELLAERVGEGLPVHMFGRTYVAQ